MLFVYFQFLLTDKDYAGFSLFLYFQLIAHFLPASSRFHFYSHVFHSLLSPLF